MAGEWDTVELGEVAAVRSGYAFKSSEWKDAGIPVVKIANVKRGRLEMSGCSYVAEATAAKSGEFQLTMGDILIAMTGYIGDVARVRETDLPCVLNQRVGKFSVRDENRLDADFLYTFLSWSETRQTIEALGYGSAQPNVSPSLIHKVELSLPSLPTQRAIASVLGTLDDLIELNRETNQILEEMARALFKSWFVDFDPVRAKLEGRPPAGMDAETAALFPDHFEDSELGQIPRGWEVGEISEIAAIKNQSVNPGSEPDRVWEHYSIPAFDVGPWPACDKGSEIKSGKYRVPERAVLLSKLNPDTPRVWLPDVDSLEAAICSTEFLPFVPRECDHRSFAFELLRSELVSSEICNRATGSTGSRQRVKPRDVERIRTVIPPDKVIRAFVSLTEPHHDMIAANRRESRDLAALRDTLLPKLLSGEVSAPEAEELVASAS